MSKLLARAKDLKPKNLEACILQEDVMLDAGKYVLQDHYTVTGSLDAHVSAVVRAYNKWRREQEYDNCCRYSWVLATFDAYIVVCVSAADGYEYYQVPYTSASGGDITFGTPVAVEVDIVVSALAPEADDSDDLGESLQGKVKPKEQAKPPEKIVLEDTLDANAEEVTVLIAEDEGVIQAAIEDDTLTYLQANLVDEGAQLREQSIVEEDGKKYRYITAIVTQADVVNSQGQVYPKDRWEKNLPRMNRMAQAGKFFGQLEHPKHGETQRGGLTQSAVLWQKFWWDTDNPKLLVGQGKVLPTDPHGKNLEVLLEADAQIDISSRGYATSTQGIFDGKEAEIMDENFICVGFDAVQHCSSPGSTVIETHIQSTNIDPATEVAKNIMTPEEKAAKEAADLKAQEQATQEAAATAAAAKELEAKTQADKDKADLREWAQGEHDGALFDNVKAKLAASAQSQLSETGLAAFNKALDKVQGSDIAGLKAIKDYTLPMLLEASPKAAPVDQSVTDAPEFYIKRDQGETAPKNGLELIDRLVRDLPDHYPGVDQANKPSHMNSPKEACRRVLINTANVNEFGFNGRAALKSLLALEQGKVDQAGEILQMQSLANPGATTVADSGAPLSNYMLFPLVRRIFPFLIMNRIASIQPMDRPDGKFFYLDGYRTNDAANGPSASNRIDLSTSAFPLNSSYADNATEGAAPQYVQLKLTNVTLQAHTKKLGTNWSIEEMQDLRAYHGLDAASELADYTAREIANEWNLEVLNDMLAQATGATRTFGTTAPASGFSNQKDWDEYIWVYLQALGNDIFGKRNGGITHLVVGMDAAIALSKSMRGVFEIGNQGRGDMEAYPGTTFYGNITTPLGDKIEVFKTNFWPAGTTNGKKILALRRGPTWSDTPYVFAPYAEYMTQVFTDPADFSQKQGFMSRAAKKVVVSDAMAVLTVSAAQGVVL